MEKLNNLLKMFISLLLLVSFVMAFSSCEQKLDEAENGHSIDTSVNETESWREEIERESQQLEEEFDSLEKKIKERGGELSEEIRTELERLDNERRDIVNDSTEEHIKERWEKFLEKTENELDSLNRKI